MPKSKDYEEHVEIVANESLDVFSKIADAAQSELDDTKTRSHFGDFANPNTFTLEKARETKGKIVKANLGSYRKLIREPAIARVVAKGDNGE
ncbi:MAG: hypothetical protein OXF09_07650, partial [Hyphomicrobiales bacterium]|nr:hypothetical protein [Hyphomicrobiales bacterium]